MNDDDKDTDTLNTGINSNFTPILVCDMKSETDTELSYKITRIYTMQIGIGYDVHRLVKGRKLILGGAIIPFEKGLLGHSDADVLVHAVCDALLGSVGLGDIGRHFPDTDPQYKDISSLTLLAQTNAMVRQKGFTIRNIDTIIFAEAPKITPYRQTMQKNLAHAVELTPGCINIKATTTEGLGVIGKGEGIGAMSVVLVE
jgi:2-C-methyl-D-erythritol 2,4-cyclodiphosphate synthase